MKEKELESLFKKYYSILFLYALSLCKNEDDAKDLVSETFLKAYLSYDETKGTFKTWTFLVLRNLFIDECRKKKKLLNENQYEIIWIKDPYDALSHYIKEENKRWLYSNIYLLPQREKDIMLMTLLWNMNDSEIADKLHIRIDLVRTIRYRVKNKLKEKAKKEGYLS